MKKSLLLVVSILLIQLLSAQDSLQFRHGTYKITLITSSNNQIANGYLESITDTSVYLSSNTVRFNGYESNTSGLTAFNYNNISKVTIRRKGSTARGMLIGAIVGAVAGVALGYADGDDYKKNPNGWCIFCLTAGEKATAGGVVFGLTGGMIGGVVGALAHKTFIIKSKKEKFDELRWQLIH